MIPQQPQHAYYNHIPGPYQQQGIDRYYPKMNEPSVIDQKPVLNLFLYFLLFNYHL